jgi:hypothetical protein
LLAFIPIADMRKISANSGKVNRNAKARLRGLAFVFAGGLWYYVPEVRSLPTFAYAFFGMEPSSGLTLSS